MLTDSAIRVDAATVTAAPTQVRQPEVKPLAPEYYKVQFTASRETYDKLRLAQDLLRHRIPNGDVAAVVDRALSVLIAELQKTKHAAVEHARRSTGTASRNRHIPASGAV